MNENTQQYIELIDKMKNTPILVIGDIMLDRFTYGRVTRISPESPVPVLAVERENMMLGGAGNTLINLIHLGCEGRIISLIGDDETGQLLKSVAKRSSVDTTGLITAQDRPTIVKTRFLAGHQQLLRSDYERIAPASKHRIKEVLEKAREQIEGARAVILSDYGKGLLVPDLIADIIKLAKDKGVPVLVDPKGCDFSIYKGADVVTPNKKELSEGAGGSAVDSDEAVVKAASCLLKTSGINAIVATRSKEGMSVIQKDKDKKGKEDVTHIKSAKDIEVFDVSGAGDSVIATIAAALGAGADIVTAAKLANIAGSIVVAKVGTAAIRAKEIKAYLEKGNDTPKTPYQAPFMNWQDAKEEVQRWKAKGLKVGFTNGCFDILHFGHVTYLNDARQHCDRLVIGLNNDASIRLLKGKSRPIHDEKARARVISALGAVDMVVLFGAQKKGEDNTPVELIEELQPDLYFKGGDYGIDKLPEAPVIARYGGEVKIMPIYEGYSTTGAIEKIKS